MKTIPIFQILLLVAISFSLAACDDEETTYSTVIPASYLDTLQWTETMWAACNELSSSFDFSEGIEVSDANKDLTLSWELTIYNDFVFEGKNHIQAYPYLNTKIPLTIPTEWENSTPSVIVGTYYVAECKDGYAIFKPSLIYRYGCREVIMKFSFVPTSALENEGAYTKQT